MKFKARCLVNTVLAISASILAVSGLALFCQVWIEGIREWHQVSGFLFIGASIIHVIINRNALGTSLKTKWAGLAVLVLVVVFLPPVIGHHSAPKARHQNSLKLADIALPAPHQSGGMPLLQALKERQTIRGYADKKLPNQVVADMLWAAFGINRLDSAKRTAPSARNWQEIEIYAVTAQGAYRYDPFANQLRAVLQGDQRQVAGMQGFVATAPLVLVYVADSGKMGNVSPADGKLYAGIDTGFISQNVYLFCASEGLGTVVLATVDRKALAATLELSPRQSIVLTQPVGYPTPIPQ